MPVTQGAWLLIEHENQFRGNWRGTEMQKKSRKKADVSMKGPISMKRNQTVIQQNHLL